jgi:hypothetical protein
VPDAIYTRDGDHVVPSEWAGSPWSRELQHGGPICGLVARAAEAAADTSQLVPREYLRHVPPGFHRSVEVRLSEDEFGPAVWLTTPLDLVAGEATSSLVRAAMLSDLTFAMAGRTLLRRRDLPEDAPVPLINADMTLYLERPPVGDWIAFRRGAVSNQRGIGLAEVQQLDRQGRYGRSLQAHIANP